MSEPGSTSHQGRDAIALGGVRAHIPARVIADLLSGASSAEPLTVDARALTITIPPDAIAEVIRAARPDLDLNVTFENSAVVVAVRDMPSIRIVVPEDGLRLMVGRDGIALLG